MKINETIQTGKEFAKPVAALLPPDGSAGCGNRKKISSGAVFGRKFTGAALSNLKNWRGWYEVPGGSPQ